MPALTKRQKAMRRMTADREAKRRQRLLEAQNPDTRPDAVSDADAEADEDPDVKYMEASTQFDKPNGELVQEIVLPEETGTDNTGLPMHSTARFANLYCIVLGMHANVRQATLFLPISWSLARRKQRRGRLGSNNFHISGAWRRREKLLKRLLSVQRRRRRNLKALPQGACH